MRRLFLLAWLAAGCVPIAPPADRLAVTDALRFACPTLSDPLIRSLVAATEQDRIAGYTRHELLAGTPEACIQADSAAGFERCLACAEAVIDQVYR